MKIVIDIPYHMYHTLIQTGKWGYYRFDAKKAIKEGTLLPKGHGRLIDADELYSIFKENCNAYNIDNLSFISDMDMNFDLAPTIIEGSDSE